MTALKLFSIAANGTDFGVFEANTAHEAIIKYVTEAGYPSIEYAAAVVEETPQDFLRAFDVEDLCETYECILNDIRDFANDGSSDHTRHLNARREELVDVSIKLEEGGLKVDWSGELDAVLFGSRYKDSKIDECALIVSIEDLSEAA